MNPKLINPCDDCLVQACCYVLKAYKTLYRRNVVSAHRLIGGCNDFNSYQVVLWKNSQAIFRLQNIAQKHKGKKSVKMGNIRMFTLSNIRKRTKKYNTKLKNKRKHL